MIRHFEMEELERAKKIHEENGLDERCFPDLQVEDVNGETIANPLFVVKEVFEHEGKPALMSFLKMTSELYLLVDHTVGTPEERWEWLKAFKEHMMVEAWKLGLDQMTAFVPADIEESFAKRLLDMGFVKSPWQSYTLNIENE